jgi:hypothetical protein
VDVTDVRIEQTDSYKPVERLYRIVYPGKSARKFAWLYTTNPSGPADIFLVRDTESKKVIASYAIMPMRLWYHNRIVKIGQAIDGMVHPDFRRRRIFNSIQQQLHDQLQKKYEFLIGFPNRLALNPLLNAGAVAFGPLVTYSFPLTSQFFAKRPKDSSILHGILSPVLKPALALHKRFYLGSIKTDGYRLEPTEEENVCFDIDYGTIREKHPMMAVRDKDFLIWRFFSVPVSKYIFLQLYHDDKALGYIAIRFEHKAVAIVDFCIDSDLDDQLRALRLLIRYCEQRRVKSIHFQMSEACYCSHALRRAGFIKRKNNYSIILFPYSEESKKLRYANFFLTFADTDWI